MGGSGKSGSQQSKNYYGTLAGALCWGPVDWLRGVVVNGNYLFQGSLTITADVTDLTGSILDPSYIGTDGYLKLYRGTETQPVDPALGDGLLAYKGTCYLVAKNFFFGQDSGTPPNLQLILGRLPRVDTSIVAAVDNVADDDQINPIAAWAELLIDDRGLGLPLSIFDAASWTAAAHWCAQDADHRKFTFISPLVGEQGAMRELAKQIIDPFNGFCRWTSDGTIACNVYEWGTDPGNLPVLDANAFTKKPNFPLGDWTNVPTEILVSFVDRNYDYQDNTVLVTNERARQVRQIDEQSRLSRKHVTRQDQAFQQAHEYNRRIGLAPSTATLHVRNPLITGLSVGDKIKVNTDPEPSGAGAAQLCRIEEITQDRTDEAQITVLTDNLVSATSYTPNYPTQSVPVPTSPPIQHMTAVPLPPAYWGSPITVGVLATRQDQTVRGFDVYFGATETGSFSDLGSQTGFAVRAQLEASCASTDTTLAFTELDGFDGPDALLAANTPGGNSTAADDNTLLALITQLDGSGRIPLNANGDPVMEFVSISDRATGTGLPANTMNYTVLRGRCGTAAQAWTSGATVWIVPRENIFQWYHDDFPALIGTSVLFRLVSYTGRIYDDTNPVPEIGCLLGTFPPSVPAGLTATVGTGKAIELNWTANPELGYIGYIVYRNTVDSMTGATEIADIAGTKLVDTQVTIGVEYYYFLEAYNASEATSGVTASVSAVPVYIPASATDNTLPNPPGAVTLAASGTTTSAAGQPFAYADFTVPAMPQNAAYQQLLYRVSGSGQWIVGAQLQNTANVTARIPDLTVGTAYEIALQAFSTFNRGSVITTATGSPFTITKSTLPQPPTNFAAHQPSSQYSVPPKYTASGFQLYGSTITFTQSTSKDVVRYEWNIQGTSTSTPSPSDSGDLSDGDKSFYYFYTGTVVAQYVWVRSWDSSGNCSAWVNTGLNMNTFISLVAGTMSSQNSSDVLVSGIQTGASGASSVRQVIARYPFDIDQTLVGGLAEETVNVDLTGRGFTTKPDGTTGAVNVSSDPALKCRYDWDDAGNSSTNAVLKVSTVVSGGTTPAGGVRLTGEFFEYN